MQTYCRCVFSKLASWITIWTLLCQIHTKSVQIRASSTNYQTTHQGAFNLHIVQLSGLRITCYSINDLHFGANGSGHLGTIYHGTTSCVGQLQSISGLAVCHSSPQFSNYFSESPLVAVKLPNFSHTILAAVFQDVFENEKKHCFSDKKNTKHLVELITFVPAVVSNPRHDWTIRGDSIRGIGSHGLLEFLRGHFLHHGRFGWVSYCGKGGVWGVESSLQVSTLIYHGFIQIPVKIPVTT